MKQLLRIVWLNGIKYLISVLPALIKAEGENDNAPDSRPDDRTDNKSDNSGNTSYCRYRGSKTYGPLLK
jgi:hypothetical protein